MKMKIKMKMNTKTILVVIVALVAIWFLFRREKYEITATQHTELVALFEKYGISEGDQSTLFNILQRVTNTLDPLSTLEPSDLANLDMIGAKSDPAFIPELQQYINNLPPS